MKEVQLHAKCQEEVIVDEAKLALWAAALFLYMQHQ